METRKIYQEELAGLKDELAAMCRLTETMIENAVRALVTCDRELGKKVAESDRQVDEYETDIEKKCLRLLWKEQPVAQDFRIISTALKMITDIERFGDQAADIGDLVATEPAGEEICLPHIAAMGELAVCMVHESVDSFVKGDETLADAVIRTDDRMDELFVAVKNDLVEQIRINRESGDRAIMLMMAAKYLERIGDHAVNVAEWTKYCRTGVHQKF